MVNITGLYIYIKSDFVNDTSQPKYRRIWSYLIHLVKDTSQPKYRRIWSYLIHLVKDTYRTF